MEVYDTLSISDYICLALAVVGLLGAPLCLLLIIRQRKTINNLRAIGRTLLSQVVEQTKVINEGKATIEEAVAIIEEVNACHARSEEEEQLLSKGRVKINLN